MRLIDADRFKENILSGLYVFCQVNKDYIARAIDDEPTVKPIGNQIIWEQGYHVGYAQGYITGIRGNKNEDHD